MTKTITLEEAKKMQEQEQEEFKKFSKRFDKFSKKGVHISYLSAEELQALKDKREAERLAEIAKKQAIRDELDKADDKFYTEYAKSKGYNLVKC